MQLFVGVLMKSQLSATALMTLIPDFYVVKII